MPSSISDSKSQAIAYAKALALICVLLMIVFEIGSVYLLNHQSATYARISRQYDEALKIRHSEAGEPPSVLMVGNSLLLHGVQVDRLQEKTSSRMRLYPIFLEATGYYDWLYGLHGLFLRGARPQVVVLGVGVNVLVQPRIRDAHAERENKGRADGRFLREVRRARGQRGAGDGLHHRQIRIVGPQLWRVRDVEPHHAHRHLRGGRVGRHAA